MPSLKKRFSGLWTGESGISSVEYALLLAFIAAGTIIGAGQLSNAVEGMMVDTANCIETNGDICE